MTEGLGGTLGLTDGSMGYPAEQRGQSTRVTSTGRKPKVELLTCGTEAEMGLRQTQAMEGVWTTEKLEGRRSLEEPKEWKVEV